MNGNMLVDIIKVIETWQAEEKVEYLGNGDMKICRKWWYLGQKMSPIWRGAKDKRKYFFILQRNQN